MRSSAELISSVLPDSADSTEENSKDDEMMIVATRREEKEVEKEAPTDTSIVFLFFAILRTENKKSSFSFMKHVFVKSTLI